MTQRFSQLGWSIVPGPGVLPSQVFPSDQVTELAEYTPEQVAHAFASLENVEILNSGEPSWWEWRAAFRGENDCFEIGFTLFELEPPLWGGSDLLGASEPRAVFALASAVRSLLPMTYLHNTEALMFSLEGFRARFLSEES